MEYQIETSDGFSQIGKLQIKKNTIDTPTILYPFVEDIPCPNESELYITTKNEIEDIPTISISTDTEKNLDLIIKNPFVYPKDLPTEIHQETVSNIKEKDTTCFVLPANNEVLKESMDTKETSLFIISNATQLFYNPTEFVTYISALQKNKKSHQIVYLPSTADPTNLSLLIYLGIDIVDTMQAIIAARNNILLFPDGRKHISKLKEIPCICPSCQKHSNPSTFEFEDILFHNYYMMINELKTIKNAIHNESLRELISLRINSSPHLTSILRLYEKNNYSIIESKTPIHRKTPVKATTLDTINRPEIKRFQQRILHRYKKPESTSILLLLPCSAKKPYSFSKSHKKFIQTIQSIKNHYTIHEMIITSPLGIVPRELELIYPASSYDIPVTGAWYEEEKEMILKLLKEYLSKNTYQKTIIHLPPPLNTYLQENIPDTISTQITASAATHQSLQKLKETLKTEIEGIETISGKTRFKENMLSLASYQFTPTLAQHLLKDTTIKGKYPYLKIFDTNNEQLGMLTETRGVISLTLPGGKRIETLNQYHVHISDNFELKGSVFAPGVIDADPTIRKGDEVIVLQNSKLTAVGVAQMNGTEMIQRTYGKAVQIRHKKD